MRQESTPTICHARGAKKIKGEESIKEGGSNERRGSENQERNTVAI